MAEGFPAIVNELNAPFCDAAAQGRLVLPFCSASERFFWPPSAISPYANRSDIRWREVKPSGRLVSRVVYRRCFQKPLEKLMPYAVGLVQLDAGPRLLAFLAHPDDPASAQAGDGVQLAFTQLVADGPWALTIAAKQHPKASMSGEGR